MHSVFGRADYVPIVTMHSLVRPILGTTDIWRCNSSTDYINNTLIIRMAIVIGNNRLRTCKVNYTINDYLISSATDTRSTLALLTDAM